MKIRKRILRVSAVTTLAVFVLLAVALSGAGTASAAPAAGKPYYQGKAIIFWVGSGAGGGTDVWCRFVARHLGRHIPGNPRIVIRNNPAGETYKWYDNVVAATEYIGPMTPP